MGNIKSCVSLYSFQNQYMTGKSSLEDLLRFVKEDCGADGVEILPDQMLHGTPNPSEKTYQEWSRLMEKYQLDLACADVFLNTTLYKNRELTKRECIDLIKQEIVMAHRLGFKTIRLVSMVPAWILEPCLEAAVKNDVIMAIEIHAGLGFGVPKTEEFLAEVLRLNSPYVGIVPDAGLFCRKFPRVTSEYCKKVYGTNEELIKYAHSVFESGIDFFELTKSRGFFEIEEAKGKGLRFESGAESRVKDPSKDMFYVANLSAYENKPLSVMDPYIKYIKHFHFKLYEMTKTGEEYSIDYKEILTYLKAHDYNGYVSTEYEGNRWTLPGKPIKEKEQVLLHQQYIKKILNEIQ